MHPQPEHLLARAVPLLDVVVDGPDVLSVLAVALAAAAGFAQLFSS